MIYRRVNRRTFLGGTALAGLGLAAAACGGGSSNKQTSGGSGTPSGTPVRGGTLRVPLATSIISLDPNTAEGVAYALNFYSYLVHATDWQGNVGDVATSWENIDELNWVFHLRDDVHFQNIPPANGRLVTANDVVKSYDRQRGMPGASIDPVVVKYSAPDPRTFTLQTKKPHGYLVMNVGAPGNVILPAEVVDQAGDLKTHAVGSGPWMLDTLGQDHMVAVRNPLYYHDFPYIDSVDYKVLTEASSRQAAFRSGSVDIFTATDKIQAQAVNDVPDATVQRYLDRIYCVFVLNGVKVPAFKDERVREAIDLALDRQQMIDKLHFGDAELAGPIPPLWDTALPKEEVASAYQRDVTRAKQLISAAGQEGLSFDLVFYTTDAHSPDRAAIIKENLAEIGVNANLQSLEMGTWITRLFSGDFEATTFNHLPYLSDFIQIQAHHSLGAGRTQSSYLGVDDPEMDALLEKEEQTIDDEERKQICLQAQRLILKRHGPTLTLYEPYSYWAAYDYLKGYTPTAYGFGLFKYDMWIDKS
jgi:peptide/nickel transport system substrate-binding protein